MKGFALICNQSGASIVGTMLFVAMLTAGAAGLSSVFLDRLKDEQQINLQQGAEMAKRNVMGTISHDGSWLATINKESSLGCLKSEGSVCFPPSNPELSLYLSDGATALVSKSDPKIGFNIQGNICDTFDKVKGNDNCPFRYSLTWSCEGGSCAPTKTPDLGTVPNSPRIVIRGIFEFKPKTKGLGKTLRPDFFNFQVVRGAEERDLSSTCDSIGGYFDQGRNHCSIQSTNDSCDPVLQYMAGLNAEGKPVCRPKLLVGTPCPPGTAATGLTVTGRLLCGKF